MPNLSHNDNPNPIDAFGQGDFIRQIAEVVKTCEAPKGIAINGYWGSGKTSALLQLHKELTGILPTDINSSPKLDITPVWFEAWRHQNEAVPIVALLQEIRNQLSIWNKFLNKTKKLTGITLTGILGAFDETLKVASGGVMSPALNKIPDIAAQWEKDHYQNQLAGQHLSQLLEDAIDQALGKTKHSDRKLVIFIDDLDRCMPDTALKLLEGIKIYLNLKNCVVVFGMDQRQIESSLRKALSLKDGSNDGDHHAREYLEKICQDIYHLPLPSQTQKSDYLYHLLTDLDLGGTPIQKTDHLAELKKILDYYDCLPANPRKIKALANRFASMLKKIQTLTPVDPRLNQPVFSPPLALKPEYSLLVTTAVIYTFHRSLNEQLAKNPLYISTLIEYARNPTPALVDNPDPLYEPMQSIKPSFNGSADLPVNPSDSHVFRLHRILIDLGTVTEAEIKPFLNL